jgi:hypothetical protein
MNLMCEARLYLDGQSPTAAVADNSPSGAIQSEQFTTTKEIPANVKKTALVFLAICVLGVLSARSLHAEHWQRPPMPSIEVLKSATFGPMPTSDQIQAAISRYIVKSSRLDPWFGIASGPLQQDGPPIRSYLYTGGSGQNASYLYGWIVSLKRVDGLFYHTRIFYQNGVPTFRSRKFSAGMTDDNCMIPIDAESSSAPSCALIGWETTLTQEYIFRGVHILPGMSAADAKKAAKAARVPAAEYHGYYFASSQWAESVLLGDFDPYKPDAGELFILQDGKISARRLHQIDFSDK